MLVACNTHSDSDHVLQNNIVRITEYGKRLVLVIPEPFDRSIMEDSCLIGDLQCDFVLSLRICIDETSYDNILVIGGRYTNEMSMEDFVIAFNDCHLFPKCVIQYVIFCADGNDMQGIQLHPYWEYCLTLYEHQPLDKRHEVCLSISWCFVIKEYICYVLVIVEQIRVNLGDEGKNRQMNFVLPQIMIEKNLTPELNLINLKRVRELLMRATCRMMRIRSSKSLCKLNTGVMSVNT